MPADQEHAARRESGGNDVVRDGLAQALGQHAEDAGTVIQVGRSDPFEPLTRDGRPQSVTHHHLLDLHLGAIGEGRGLIDADALEPRPVRHVLGRWIMIQITLHVAVDERFETHLQRFFMQRCKRPRLVPFRFGDEALAGQVRAGGHLQFGVDRDHRQASLESAFDDFGAMENITTAFDDEVGMIDQVVDRMGQPFGQWKIAEGVERASGQNPGDFQVRIMLLDQSQETPRDHSRAGYTDLFGMWVGHN